MSLIHTCYRVLEDDRSTDFYSALGFCELGRLPIRDEAINVFMGLPEDGDEPRLELTYNVGHTEAYDIGTGYGHIAITTSNIKRAPATVTSRSRPRTSTPRGSSWPVRGSSPNGRRIRCARAGPGCASCAIPT